MEHDGPAPSPGLPNSPKWPAKFARVGAQAVFVASNSGTQEDVQRVRAGAAAPVKMLRDDLMMVIHPNPKPMLQPFLTALVLDYAPRSRRLDDGDKP